MRCRRVHRGPATARSAGWSGRNLAEETERGVVQQGSKLADSWRSGAFRSRDSEMVAASRSTTERISLAGRPGATAIIGGATRRKSQRTSPRAADLKAPAGAGTSTGEKSMCFGISVYSMRVKPNRGTLRHPRRRERLARLF